MAVDFISVNPAASGASQARDLIQLKELGRQFYSLGKKVLGVMGHANDGTAFTVVETLYGLPAGTGQTVFNLVNGAIGSTEGTFQVADFKTLTEKVG